MNIDNILFLLVLSATALLFSCLMFTLDKLQTIKEDKKRLTEDFERVFREKEQIKKELNRCRLRLDLVVRAMKDKV